MTSQTQTQNPDLNAATLYDGWRDAVKTAASSSLPIKKNEAMSARDVSAKTNKLFTQRSDMNRDRSSTEEYKGIQKRIKESCLQDYKS